MIRTAGLSGADPSTVRRSAAALGLAPVRSVSDTDTMTISRLGLLLLTCLAAVLPAAAQTQPTPPEDRGRISTLIPLGINRNLTGDAAESSGVSAGFEMQWDRAVARGAMSDWRVVLGAGIGYDEMRISADDASTVRAAFRDLRLRLGLRWLTDTGFFIGPSGTLFYVLAGEIEEGGTTRSLGEGDRRWYAALGLDGGFDLRISDSWVLPLAVAVSVNLNTQGTLRSRAVFYSGLRYLIR